MEGYSDVTADNWQDGVFGQMDAKNCEGGESSALWKEHTSIKVNSPVSGAGHVTTILPLMLMIWFYNMPVLAIIEISLMNLL